MKVSQFKVKNQFIMESETERIFQSYNSTIAIYNKDTEKLTLGRDWDYSTTTAKYLYQFIQEETVCKDNDNYFIGGQLRGKSNKRAYINKLIDNGTINYKEGLK